MLIVRMHWMAFEDPGTRTRLSVFGSESTVASVRRTARDIGMNLKMNWIFENQIPKGFCDSLITLIRLCLHRIHPLLVLLCGRFRIIFGLGDREGTSRISLMIIILPAIPLSYIWKSQNAESSEADGHTDIRSKQIKDKSSF
jgi:hypothetical protein